MEARTKRPAPPLTPDLFRQEQITIIIKPDTAVETRLFNLLQIANARADRLQRQVERLQEQKRLSICWTKVRKSVRLTPSRKDNTE